MHAAAMKHVPIAEYNPMECPVCACDFYDSLGLGQPTVSYHLKKLTEAGLLEREQRGKWAYFSLRPEAAERLAAVADLRAVCC